MIILKIWNVKFMKQIVILAMYYALSLFLFWKTSYIIVTFPQKILYDIMYFFQGMVLKNALVICIFYLYLGQKFSITVFRL